MHFISRKQTNEELKFKTKKSFTHINIDVLILIYISIDFDVLIQQPYEVFLNENICILSMSSGQHVSLHGVPLNTKEKKICFEENVFLFYSLGKCGTM